MSEKNQSHKQILKSSSIIGGASVIGIFIGLFKIKVVAVLLGPVGIGLIGLLQNIMAMAASVAGMGLGLAGTRQIAEANADNNQQSIARARRALFLGTMLLAGLGGLLVWLFKEPLAITFLSDINKSKWIGWLAIGVMLTVAASSQNALLNGMRRIADLAKLQIYSSVFATVLGISGVWLWQEEGLVIFVISVPLVTFIIGHIYVSRLPKVVVKPTPFNEIKAEWNILLRLGFAFMAAGLAATLGQLAIRSLVQSKLGSADLGLFQAAWTISMIYIGFVLAAMSADYYPRLTGVIRDREATIRLVNEQTEIALLLSGPVFLAMLTLAPWVLMILYTSEFTQAAQILRWQILGDIIKVISWPLGFTIIAMGATKTYLLFESIVMIIFYIVTWLGLDYFGIEATGIGFLVMYLFYLPIVYFWARYKIGFKWDKQVKNNAITLSLTAMTINFASSYDKWLGLILGAILTLYFLVVNVTVLMKIGGNISLIKKFSNFFKRIKRKY